MCRDMAHGYIKKPAQINTHLKRYIYTVCNIHRTWTRHRHTRAPIHIQNHTHRHATMRIHTNTHRKQHAHIHNTEKPEYHYSQQYVYVDIEIVIEYT